MPSSGTKRLVRGCIQVVSDNMDNEQFDLVIIGSGSGNSIPEYLSNWNIAIVERGVYGGTCLNVGCIPSKMFVLPADAALAAGNGAKLGIDTQFNGADFRAIRDRVFGRIDEISAGGREYRATGSPNVTLLEGTASFIGDKVFRVDMNDGGQRTISGDKVLLAAGARPVVPQISGLAEVGFHTSDTIMRLDDLPKRLGIIGGGFIAVEMGHVFSGLGSDVTLFNRSNTLLRGFDNDIADRFTEIFAERVHLRLGVVPTHVERTADGIALTVGAETVIVDELLVATGREPNSDLVDVRAVASNAITAAPLSLTTRWRAPWTTSGQLATSPTATSLSIWPTLKPRWRSGTSPIPTTFAIRATRQFREQCFPIRRSPASA